VQYQKVHILKGNGQDGKSTLGRILEACIPPGSVVHLPPQKMNEDYHLGELPGKLLNIVYELSERELLSTNGFKQVSVGDGTEGRVVGQRVVHFKPVVGHVFLCQSHMPPTSDHSYGFRRRFTILQFNHQIQNHEKKVDDEKHLIANELPEIVAWALRGMERLVKQGKYTEVSGRFILATFGKRLPGFGQRRRESEYKAHLREWIKRQVG
jgi:putative DNA primase/helicase